MRTERAEQIVIRRRRRQIIARGRGRREPLGPPRALRHLAHERKRRLLGVVGHLHGQHAASGQRRQQPPQHRGMVGNPLKDGVGEQQVSALLRAPIGEIGLGEFAIGKPFARLTQHVGRGVEADHPRLRITLHQKRGGIAGPTAEIDHAARRLKRHLRQQIARWPRALVLEFEVLAGTPIVGHQRENFLYLIRCGMVEFASSRRILSCSPPVIYAKGRPSICLRISGRWRRPSLPSPRSATG